MCNSYVSLNNMPPEVRSMIKLKTLGCMKLSSHCLPLSYDCQGEISKLHWGKENSVFQQNCCEVQIGEIISLKIIVLIRTNSSIHLHCFDCEKRIQSKCKCILLQLYGREKSHQCECQAQQFSLLSLSYLYLCPTVGIGCHLQNIRIGAKSRVEPIVTQQGDSFFQPSVELCDLQIIFFRGYISMGISKGMV